MTEQRTEPPTAESERWEFEIAVPPVEQRISTLRISCGEASVYVRYHGSGNEYIGEVGDLTPAAGPGPLEATIAEASAYVQHAERRRLLHASVDTTINSQTETAEQP